MPISHIVAFKTATPTGLAPLTAAFLALAKECISPTTGQPYILAVDGGKQVSKEGADKGMQLVFVMQFQNDDDLQYYLNKDPAHENFKNAIGQWGTTDFVVFDFVSGKY